MNLLFTPGKIGTLTLPNRLVRSATAERMADADGRPLPKMKALYDELASGEPAADCNGLAEGFGSVRTNPLIRYHPLPGWAAENLQRIVTD